MYTMLIPPDKVNSTREWFKTRGGVLLWSNQEIGAVRSDIMTPASDEKGTNNTRPHWAYGNPISLQPNQIGIRAEKKIPLPPEWFPVCPQCNGTKKRSLKKLAEARGVSVVGLIEEHTKTPIYGLKGIDLDRAEFDCWQCDGTGHINRYMTIRVKREYWGGYTMSQTGKGKGERTANKLQKLYPDEPKIQFDFEHIGNGLANLVFYTEVISPFTLEDSSVSDPQTAAANPRLRADEEPNG